MRLLFVEEFDASDSLDPSEIPSAATVVYDESEATANISGGFGAISDAQAVVDTLSVVESTVSDITLTDGEQEVVKAAVEGLLVSLGKRRGTHVSVEGIGQTIKDVIAKVIAFFKRMIEKVMEWLGFKRDQVKKTEVEIKKTQDNSNKIKKAMGSDAPIVDKVIQEINDSPIVQKPQHGTKEETTSTPKTSGGYTPPVFEFKAGFACFFELSHDKTKIIPLYKLDQNGKIHEDIYDTILSKLDDDEFINDYSTLVKDVKELFETGFAIAVESAKTKEPEPFCVFLEELDAVIHKVYDKAPPVGNIYLPNNRAYEHLGDFKDRLAEIKKSGTLTTSLIDKLHLIGHRTAKPHITVDQEAVDATKNIYVHVPQQSKQYSRSMKMQSLIHALNRISKETETLTNQLMFSVRDLEKEFNSNFNREGDAVSLSIYKSIMNATQGFVGEYIKGMKLHMDVRLNALNVASHNSYLASKQMVDGISKWGSGVGDSFQNSLKKGATPEEKHAAVRKMLGIKG
jgi:hypothetical protein